VAVDHGPFVEGSLHILPVLMGSFHVSSIEDDAGNGYRSQQQWGAMMKFMPLSMAAMSWFSRSRAA